MLNIKQLQKVANFVADHMTEAHRGAVPLGRGRSVIVFGCEGYTDPRVLRAAAITRTILTADGFAVGEVATDTAYGDVWVLEATAPAGTDLETATERCESAVWEAWAAVRNLDPDRDPFACLQRGIALGVTAGRTLACCL